MEDPFSHDLPSPKWNQEIEPDWKQRYHDAKVKYYSEFLKRMFFEAKYINLCKLCDEYMEELVEALTSIVNRQKSIIDSPSLLNDIPVEVGLDVIPEQTEEETLDTAKPKDISYKINKIQERINQIEEYDMSILERYRKDIKELHRDLVSTSNQKESYSATIDELRRQVNQLRSKDEDLRRKDKDERDKSIEKKYLAEQQNNSELNHKLNQMQTEFANLQSYIKSLNISKDQLELEQAKRDIKSAHDKVHDTENKVQRLEKLIKDKEALIAELTRNLNTVEKQLSATTKEKETITSQRNSAEARLKVVQGSLKPLEKEKERLGSVLLKKEQYVEQLEIESKTLQNELDAERRNSTKKLDDIQYSVHDLSKQMKQKETELELLKSAKLEYQNECQHLSKALFDKDREIAELKKDKDQLQINLEETIQSYEVMYKRKIEDNFASVVNYIEDKENEIESLRKQLALKEYENSHNASHEGRKLKDMENVMLNLAREVREKEEEINQLKGFVDNYKAMVAELQNLNNY